MIDKSQGNNSDWCPILERVIMPRLMDKYEGNDAQIDSHRVIILRDVQIIEYNWEIAKGNNYHIDVQN